MVDLTEISPRQRYLDHLKKGELAYQVCSDDGQVIFYPRAVAPDSKGNVYVLERGGHALRVVRPNGKIYTVAGTGKRGKQDGPGKQATLGAPKHICVDDADNVYIADEANDLIRKYDPKTGEVSTVLGHGKVKLDYPHGVTWEKGKLYVVDTGHNRILRIED